MRVEDFFGVEVDVDEVARWAREGDDLETILTRLRNMGCELAACVAVLGVAGVMPLSEANAAVIHSETWTDERDGTLAIQEDWSNALFGEIEDPPK